MNYHNITYPDMNNGTGLRVCLWLSGCSHHCPECQNPLTWNPDGGVVFYDSAKNELFRELEKDYISGLTLSGGDPLYENNLLEVLNLVNEIKISFGNTKTIWLYTGYTWEECFFYSKANDEINRVLTPFINNNPDLTINNSQIIYCSSSKHVMRQEIVSKCDVLVDGRYIHELRDISLPYRGSTNQRLIDIQKSLQDYKIVEWKVK